MGEINKTHWARDVNRAETGTCKRDLGHRTPVLIVAKGLGKGTEVGLADVEHAEFMIWRIEPSGRRFSIEVERFAVRFMTAKPPRFGHRDDGERSLIQVGRWFSNRPWGRLMAAHCRCRLRLSGGLRAVVVGGRKHLGISPIPQRIKWPLAIQPYIAGQHEDRLRPAIIASQGSEHLRQPRTQPSRIKLPGGIAKTASPQIEPNQVPLPPAVIHRLTSDAKDVCHLRGCDASALLSQQPLFGPKPTQTSRRQRIPLPEGRQYLWLLKQLREDGEVRGGAGDFQELGRARLRRRLRQRLNRASGYRRAVLPFEDHFAEMNQRLGGIAGSVRYLRRQFL